MNNKCNLYDCNNEQEHSVMYDGKWINICDECMNKKETYIDEYKRDHDNAHEASIRTANYEKARMIYSKEKMDKIFKNVCADKYNITIHEDEYFWKHKERWEKEKESYE